MGPDEIEPADPTRWEIPFPCFSIESDNGRGFVVNEDKESGNLDVPLFSDVDRANRYKQSVGISVERPNILIDSRHELFKFLVKTRSAGATRLFFDPAFNVGSRPEVFRDIDGLVRKLHMKLLHDEE